MSSPLLPLSAAAAELGVDPSTLRRQAIAGRIAAVKLGPRAWMIEADEIERYRREQLGRPGRPAVKKAAPAAAEEVPS